MHIINQETLIKILEEKPGVALVSYGRPRDAFELSINVPNWTSGYGNKYEMRHTNVPKGTMIAVGNLEDLDLTDQTLLKSQLKDIDIYPTGHSGDFTGTDTKVLQHWFTSRSRIDNEANNQSPLVRAKNLTPRGLGQERFEDLVQYLADNMNLFKNPDLKGIFVPSNREERILIVENLLEGLSKSIRYTRMDNPVMAYQIAHRVMIDKGNESAINLNLVEEHKIILVRKNPDGTSDITPLDRDMLGKTYITADGEPLGTKGIIDMEEIMEKANQLEMQGQPNIPLPYLRSPAPNDTPSPHPIETRQTGTLTL